MVEGEPEVLKLSVLRAIIGNLVELNDPNLVNKFIDTVLGTKPPLPDKGDKLIKMAGDAKKEEIRFQEKLHELMNEMTLIVNDMIDRYAGVSPEAVEDLQEIISLLPVSSYFRHLMLQKLRIYKVIHEWKRGYRV